MKKKKKEEKEEDNPIEEDDQKNIQLNFEYVPDRNHLILPLFMSNITKIHQKMKLMNLIII